jgi:hypothetical protein
VGNGAGDALVCIGQGDDCSATNEPEQCSTSFCTDGFCCNELCGDECETCDTTFGPQGVCTTATVGWVDPDNCIGNHGDCNAACDSSGSCAWPDDTTLCDAQVCHACNGAGDCNQVPSVNDPGCTFDCNSVTYYQQAGDPDGWDSITICYSAPADDGDTDAVCDGLNDCFNNMEWCQAPSSGWTPVSGDLGTATLCEMYGSSCAGTSAPTEAEATSGEACNTNPDAECWEMDSQPTCDIVEDPRPVWPENGSNIWPYNSNDLLFQQRFVFETPLEDPGMFPLTVSYPQYEIEFSYTRGGFAAPVYTLSNCDHNLDPDFPGMVVCTNDGWVPTPPGLYVYWRAVQKYEYDAGIGEVAQESMAWSIRAQAPNDVDDDGRSDLVVGLNGADAVMFLGSSLDSITPPTGSSSADVVFVVGGGDTFARRKVHMLGDVTGDGVQDLAVTYASGNEQPAGPAVYVVAGRTPWPATVDVTIDANTFKVTPIGGSDSIPQAYDRYFGQAVTGADLNGDGIDDLVIGEHRRQGLDLSELDGTVYVFYGPIDDFRVCDPGHASYSTHGPNLILGGATDSDLSTAIADAGDVNGDGYVDLIVGAAGTSKAYVLRGGGFLPADGSYAIETVSGLSNYTVFTGSSRGGLHAAKARDVNRDGYADVLISAPQYESENGTTVVVFSPGTAAETVTISTAANWDHMQSPVDTCSSCGRYYGIAGALGRFDGNLGADLVGGAPDDSFNGSAYLVYDLSTTSSLPAELLLETDADVILRAEASGEEFARFATVLGDFDRDGLEDVVIADAGHGDQDVGRIYIIAGPTLQNWKSQTSPYLPPNYNDAIIIDGEEGNFRYFGRTIGSYLAPSSAGWTNLTYY